MDNVLVYFLFAVIGTSVGCTKNVPGSSATVASVRTNAERLPPLLCITGGEILTPDLDPSVKALVLVFILTDCPICNAYMPELNRLSEAFDKRGISIVIVDVDPDSTYERANAHAKEYYSRPLYAFDGERVWIEKAGVTTAPEAAVFSPQGELLYRGRIDDQYVGLGKRRSVVTSHDLRNALEAILAGKPVPQPRTKAIGCPIPGVDQ